MADHRHDELRRLFDLIIEAPPGDRGALLDRECRDDAGLRRRIEAMIAAADDVRFLASPTGDLLPSASSAAKAALERMAGAGTIATTGHEAPGTRIGPYKLLQLIGEGGFGSVFAAEQEKPVQRRVALKIIKLGMDTRQVVARFEAERQALALMDHANIAKVFDAGATDTGRPYFVMELVKGEPITHYCDKGGLTITERLELFTHVCQAVQHAHTKGVIHRDLKPSNILVSNQDGRPHAKVIDFGIAKATSARLTEKTLYTEHRQLIGTPEYMSPEQAEGSLDIDTRTDVYSLGVLLYELLTGSTPFSGKDLRSAAYAEIQRIIREVDPPNPSTRLTQNTETIASVAASRRTEPKKLGTIIRGELDWIVMKALEKDRLRRYETASGLGLDIRRYLAGEAVLAAPHSAGYRVGKFVKRHKGSVVASAAVAAALVLGIIGFAWQASIAGRQRDIATREAARATATTAFIEQMLVAADPEENGTRDVTVAQLLTRASASAGKTLADQPLIEGAARTLLGNTFRSLGKVDAASAELERALALRAGAEANTFPHAETLRDLGLLLSDKGDEEAALRAFQQAQAILMTLGDARLQAAVDVRIDLARTHAHLSQFAPAEQSLDRAESEMKRGGLADPGQRAEIAVLRSELANTWHGDPKKAEQFCVEEVALRRQANQPSSLAKSLNNLAVRKVNLGKLDEAQPLYEEAIEISMREYGEAHHFTASLMENLANVYRVRKDYEKSLSTLRQVLAIRESVFGADSLAAAKTRLNMGVIAINKKDYTQALELTDAALTVLRARLGDKHMDVAQAVRNRAMCLKGLGDADGALRENLAALAIYDEVAGPATAARLRVLLDITDAYAAQGALEDAERIANSALTVLDPNNPENAKWIKSFQTRLTKSHEAPAPSDPPGAPPERK